MRYVHAETYAASPVRTEILSGRALVAFCDPILESAVIEAARIAGRLSDIRIVVAPNGIEPPFDDGGARSYQPPDDLPIRKLPRPSRNPKSQTNNLLPVLTMESVGGAGEILLIRIGPTPQLSRECFRVLQRAVLDRADIEHRDAPVRIAPIAMARTEHHAPHETRREFTTLGIRYMATAVQNILDRAFEAVGWTEAVTAFRKSLKEHESPCLHALLSPHRLVAVHVRTVEDEEDGPIKLIRVYEVDGFGIPRCGELRGSPRNPVSLSVIAMEVFIGGIARLDSTACRAAVTPTPAGSTAYPWRRS